LAGIWLGSGYGAWFVYREGDGGVEGGWLGLDSLTGLVWLGSLLADHRLGVVTGHVVELHTVAKQQNNNRSASGIQGVTKLTMRIKFFFN
jgi:hypothetical protein